jgi:hypothetical protein
MLFSDREIVLEMFREESLHLHLQLQVANPPSATDPSFSPFTATSVPFYKSYVF